MRAFQLSHRGAIGAAALAAWVFLGGPAAAQDADYTAVTSPFQEDFEYRIGADLRPLVAVDGVRWIRFAIQPKSDREYDPTTGKPVELLPLEITDGQAWNRHLEFLRREFDTWTFGQV